MADVDDLGRLALDDGRAEHARRCRSPTSMSSRSSTMSTISSTTRPIERPPSENTSSGWAPSSLDARRSSLTRTSGISWPRYCTMWRPFESSILRASISSSRVTSDSGTALGCVRAGAEHQQRHRLSRSARAARPAPSARVDLRASTVAPTACATPFGSMIMITEPSPRMVLPENIAMWRSLLDIGLTTISSVWNTPSTTMPKVWLPTCVTTMKPFSGIAARRPRARAAGSGGPAAAACRAGAAPAYP